MLDIADLLESLAISTISFCSVVEIATLTMMIRYIGSYRKSVKYCMAMLRKVSIDRENVRQRKLRVKLLNAMLW